MRTNVKLRNLVIVGSALAIFLFMLEASTRNQRHRAYSNVYTSVRCNGECCASTYQNRSCVWSNLYFNQGRFYALMQNYGSQNQSQYSTLLVNRNPLVNVGELNSEGQAKFYWNVSSQPFFPGTLPVSHITLDDILNSLEIKEGLYVMFTRFFPRNWGHAILDDLLPAFHALLQLGFSPNSKFKPLFWNDDEPDHWSSEKIIETFSGNDVEWPQKQWSKSRWIRIETLVVGTSQKGQRSITPSYEIPGNDLNLLRLFRDRIYTSYKMPPPEQRSSSMQTRTAEQKLKIFIAKNKRDMGDLDAHAQAIREALPNVHARVLDFEQYTNFRKQLQLFWTMDVYITGPGTSITPSFLLPDGSVVINLGAVVNVTQKRSIDFMEEYIAASMDWVKAFYPDPDWRRKNITSSEHVAELAVRAVETIRSNFKIPVSTYDNLSDQGKLMAKYLPADRKTWGVMSGSGAAKKSPETTEKCMGWAVNINCEPDIWERDCSPLDRDLLDSLRTELNADRFC